MLSTTSLPPVAKGGLGAIRSVRSQTGVDRLLPWAGGKARRRGPTNVICRARGTGIDSRRNQPPGECHEILYGVCFVGPYPLCRRVLDESARTLDGIGAAASQNWRASGPSAR